MSHDNLENRLNKLKKSYDKLPSAQPVEETVVQVEQQLSKKKTRKWLKSVATLAAAACIFVTGGLTWEFVQKPKEEQGLLASFQEEQENELQARLKFEAMKMKVKVEKQRLSNQVYDDWLERLGVLYTEWREAARADLQLDEDTFSQLPFVSNADSRYDSYSGRFYREYFDRVDEQQYEAELYTMIATPNQLLDIYFKEPEFYEVNQLIFIDLYAEKINGLKQFTQERYEKNASDPFVKKMESQQLFVVETSFDKRIGFEYKNNESKFKNVFSASEMGFFENIKMDYYLFGGDLLYPFDETINTLLRLEKTLLDSSLESYKQYESVEMYYNFVVMQLLKGDLVDSVLINGEMTKEYRELLQRFEKESVIVHVLAEELLNMSTSTVLNFLNALSTITIEAAVLQAQTISE